MLNAPILSALSSSLLLPSEEEDAEGVGDGVVEEVGVSTGEGIGGVLLKGGEPPWISAISVGDYF
jgi:hypothetical protein